MDPTRRARLVWLPPAAFTLGWLVFVLANDHVDRVTGHWTSAVTMVFGSFVAGSTPQGGGAVAFPVFTKILEVPSPVARSFSLIIQSTGMVMASVTILSAGRKVDYKVLRLAIVGGTVGFVAGAFLLGDPDTTFWEPITRPNYVEVTFTIAVTMVATIVWLCAGRTFRPGAITGWTRRGEMGLIAFTMAGGLASALIGSGVDVFLFLFAVLVGGLHPRIGVPTSVIAMAWLSILGLVLFGIIHGQLDITLVGDQVVAVGGDRIQPLTADQADLFGLWLAAAPVVAWGAPFGSWVASRLPERVLIGFVAFMALTELATTLIFLPALRTNPMLAAYGVIGLAAALAGTIWVARRGPGVFGFEPTLPAREIEPPAPTEVVRVSPPRSEPALR